MKDHICSDWSKIFREDSGAAKYWSWASLSVNSKYPDQREDLLNARILRLVPEISIRTKRADHQLMQLVLQSIQDGVTFNLKKLTINSVPVNIDPGLLATAVLKVQDCTIYRAPPCHLETVLTAIRDSTTTILRHLDLGYSGHQVSPDILAEAAMKLETLKARFSRPQVEAILTRLAASQDSRLRRLGIRDGPVTISTLDPEVVAGALVKLETVGDVLSYGLSAGQLLALISRINNSPDLRLKELILYGKYLSLVPPEVLVGAIQRLEVAEFWRGKMTGEQLTAILTLAKENRLGRIKIIRINRVAGMGSVSPSLLQEARLNSKLEWIG